MFDQLRDRFTHYLSSHQLGIISTTGGGNAWAMPIRYYSQDLNLICLIPRWADVVYHLEQDPTVLVIIPTDETCWLQYLATAQLADPQALAEILPTTALDSRYVAAHLTPRRIDLIDERRGWGSRETLEL
jgi:hypothetical protein